MKLFRDELWILVIFLGLAPAPASADLSDAVTDYNQGRYTAAYTEFIRLSQKGNAMAQYNLGVMYAKGHGVTKNSVEAVEWFRKAAHKGNSHAQYNLGVMYAQGEGVTQDFVRALMWLNIAEADKTKHALDQMALYAAQAIVRKEMTRDQIADADQLAKEWLEGKR